MTAAVSSGEKFQPTLPARGATRGVLRRPARLSISTHAPRTGSDVIRNWRKPADSLFQPTLPARGATGYARIPQNPRMISTHAPRTGSDGTPYITNGRAFSISTHAPRTGSDFNAYETINRNRISTHAPRTGSDFSRLQILLALYNFNPRSPHGERRLITIAYKMAEQISTHAPRTGSDAMTYITTL